MDPVTATAVTKATSAAAEILEKESETFLGAVVGEPAKAFGGLLADKINVRRHANLVRVTAEAKRLLADAGVSAREVPLSIIHPALEAASLEEDPDLRAIWTNLLANAADPRQSKHISASFAIILKELTARDVKFLDALWSNGADPRRHTFEMTEIAYGHDELLRTYADAGLSRRKRLSGLTMGDWNENGIEIEADIRDFGFMLAMFQRHLILQAIQHAVPVPVDVSSILRSGRVPQSLKIDMKRSYFFTELGTSFVAACRTPRQKD